MTLTTTGTIGAKPGQRVGYIRVSTIDQYAGRQLAGIDLDKSFTDHASGKHTERPQLARCLDYVREGDTLMVHAMDRLARNLDDLRRVVRELTARGVTVTFVAENLTFTAEATPLAQLLLSVMGAFAEFERALIRERQREGIAIAKAKGVYKGRKRVLTPEQVAAIRARVDKREKVAALAREHRVSRATVHRYLAGAVGMSAAAPAISGQS